MNLYNRVHWTHLKTENITVSVNPGAQAKTAVFQVRSVIDNGRGHHRVVLGDPEFLILETDYLMDPHKIVPPRLGNMDMIYTGRFAMHVGNLHKALAEFYKDAKVERIVPDILEPGDFIVFQKPARRGAKIQMVESLRVMTKRKLRKYQTPHAL